MLGNIVMDEEWSIGQMQYRQPPRQRSPDCRPGRLSARVGDHNDAKPQGRAKALAALTDLLLGAVLLDVVDQLARR